MKKAFIAVLLVLLISVSGVFALDGFSFFAGVGFDARKVKSLNDSASSLDFEAGAKYPIGNGFNVYTDVGFRFVGKAKLGAEEIKKDFHGVNARAGVLYGMRFVNSPEFETYLGGGLSFASTGVTESESKKSSFSNFGLGFKTILAYRFSEKFAVTMTEMPDVYLFNNGHFCLGVANTFTLGTMFKF